ncbi:MAG: hypothetical protein MJ252_28885 [archaeon]|nr:hypothetical protein [archaeon]
MKEGEQINQEEKKAEGEAVKKKTRCKNWPKCKDPNCLYAHPTETVIIAFNFNF